MGFSRGPSVALPLRIPFSLDLFGHATHHGRQGEDALRGSAGASFFPRDHQCWNDHRADANRGCAAAACELWGILIHHDLYVFGARLERLQGTVDILRSICHP